MFKKTLMVIILAATQAFAQQAKDVRTNDKLDIKKLEEKYWAAKDEDFAVVQNRRYTKAERFFLSASSGVPFNDPYSSGTLFSGSLGYYFNERWGLDVTYTSANLSDNDSVTQFKNSYGAVPDHNVFKSSYFLSGNIVPFYAKMSMMDKAIIYFDMGASVGVGMIDYDITQKEGPITKNTPAAKLGIYQQIFFSEHFAIRVDLINTWSNQDKAKYYAPGTTVNGQPVTGARDLGNKMINDTSLTIGLTYWH